MNRIPVSSSTIDSIGYDPESAILEIEFQNRSIYLYFDIPPYIHDDLMSASSHGRYFNALIKKSHFSYMKIR